MICKECGKEKRKVALGLCSNCYGRYIMKKNTAVCAGCKETKPIKCKGLCQKCYARFQRHGDTSHERKKKGDTLCAYCHEKPAHAKGYCKRCYGRYRTTGSPEYKRRVITCRVSGCRREGVNKGYCDKHRGVGWSRAKEINAHLVRTYNITTEDYQEKLRQQNGVCAICGKLETKEYNGSVINLAVDHCHTAGKVRGLLCNSCNVALGGFKDSKELLTKAINYLHQHED